MRHLSILIFIKFTFNQIKFNQNNFTGLKIFKFTLFDLKICFKICLKSKNYKSPSMIRTHDLQVHIVNALNHYAMLLNNKFVQEKNYTLICCLF